MKEGILIPQLPFFIGEYKVIYHEPWYFRAHILHLYIGSKHLEKNQHYLLLVLVLV